jgi:1-acyl-sn-glycerol-3-phosphate acyltransferase
LRWGSEMSEPPIKAGWRGKLGLVPRPAKALETARRRSPFPTGWARSLPVRAVREVVQVGGLGPLIRREVTLDVHGLGELREFHGPALIVANHSSHLDTAVLLTTLPPERRRKTAVAAAADYFFDTWWRASGSAIAFNTFPIERRGGSTMSTPGELLREGWSLIVYPEGTRSSDGLMGRFRMGAAWLAVEHQVPVIPVGLRGTYAAMPRGRAWPARGRPRVSVRYGTPIVPLPGETPRQLAPKITAAVRQLIAEDETTWWETQREAGRPVAPPAASWRRIWLQSAPPVKGGRPRVRRIWRV